MKKALLLHNPGAGDEEHNEENLTKLITSNGFKCEYVSVKEDDWKDFDYEFDVLVIAGGDGTVRKVAKKLLRRKMIDKTWPIGLLPYGTANNIAKTLELKHGDDEHLIRAWKQNNIRKYDVGRVDDIPDTSLFLESMGYGVFPYLMINMKKRKAPEDETPQQQIEAALAMLQGIIHTYEPHKCELTIDGQDHSGHFMMLEVMNTKSIGPNLFLAPEADPGDGMFDIVVVSDRDKERFEKYVAGKLQGKELPFDFTRFSGKNIVISWEGTHVHVDDEVIKLKPGKKIKIEIKEGLLQFLV